MALEHYHGTMRVRRDIHFELASETCLCVTDQADSAWLSTTEMWPESFALAFPKGVAKHIAVLRRLISLLEGDDGKGSGEGEAPPDAD